MYRHILCLALLLIVNYASAQQRERTTLWGLGSASVYDTYLSPLSYRGPQLSFEYATKRELQRNRKVLFHTSTHLTAAYTHNIAKTANEPNAMLTFDAGWSRQWHVAQDFTLNAGGVAGLLLGGTYNTQNGNNPAQGRVATNLSAMVGARYEKKIRRRFLRIDYQAQLPFLGMMFSPNYGQSYYNIFLQGNWGGNLVATHPGNALSVRQRLTFSIPIHRRTLVVGYENEMLQAKPNNLRQHHWSHMAVLGWTIDKH